MIFLHFSFQFLFLIFLFLMLSNIYQNYQLFYHFYFILILFFYFCHLFFFFFSINRFSAMPNPNHDDNEEHKPWWVYDLLKQQKNKKQSEKELFLFCLNLINFFYLLVYFFVLFSHILSTKMNFIRDDNGKKVLFHLLPPEKPFFNVCKKSKRSS